MHAETDGPGVYITAMGKKTAVHHNRVIQVVMNQGDSISDSSCYSSSILPTKLSWDVAGEDSAVLPSGVKEYHDKAIKVLNLVWSRPLVFSDSGQYSCTALNKNGANTAKLDLLVRREWL